MINERLTANAEVATVLGSFPASSDTVESEETADEAEWITYIKNIKKIVINLFSTSMQCGNLESYTGSGHAQQAMKSFLRMLSKRWNHFCVCFSKRLNHFHACSASDEIRFRVCSVCDEIVSAYAQRAFGCPCENCRNVNAGWAYAKIRSAYAQCAMKSFPCMLTVR